ncbi:MAG TPA: PIG-L family deacetylase [Desulfatiglandales bacterium]|nr:PIG-L family deacetylase [Desulfatiglandales bacterium]
MNIPDIESIRHSYRHVYISPHNDDVVMSCGGRIAKQLKRGESVLVVTVFAGDMEQGKKPRGMIFDHINDIKGRKAEDEKAMQRLGADYLWLNYIDSIFRHRIAFLRFGLYPWTSINEKGQYKFIMEDILRICEKAENMELYLPLGAGQHEDHHILFQVGREIMHRLTKHIKINFYEDVPYIFFPNILRYRIQLIGIKDRPLFLDDNTAHKKSIMRETAELYKAITGVPTLRPGNPVLKPFAFFALMLSITLIALLSKYGTSARQPKISQETCDVSDLMPEKLAAIMEYQTQIKALSWDKDELDYCFYRYSRSISKKEGQYLERYWKIDRDYNIID